MNRLLFAALLLVAALSLAGRRVVAPKETLSDYGFFTGNPADQRPAPGVVPYALNTPLFSDYAEKLRFVKLPAGQAVAYNPTDVLDFPVGTTLIKTFFYPTDFRDPKKGRRLLETRLLIHEPDGWKALGYVWNDTQTDALLDVAGDTKTVSYVAADGKKRSHAYAVPNLNQCKGCHNRAEQLRPIGPSARQLNGEILYENGTENQLLHWQKTGLLTGLPALADCPKTPVWNRPETGSLDARARAWLDVNCAHCHRPDGPASTSGLNLSVFETNPTALGIRKTPVAAGRGSGGRQFDIVPGKPDASILLYRLDATDPGVMMPELGRKTIPREGVELVRAWIKSLPE